MCGMNLIRMMEGCQKIMPDKTLAWAIDEIEAATAKAIKNREYFRAAVRKPANRNAATYLAFARQALQNWAGQVYGLEDARAILKQVDA